MQEPEDKIQDAMHPLCGFRGKQITTLSKISMPITFGYIHNTRTEEVVFDIVDMEYPYNAIIGRGTLNAFEAVLHLAYLCMKNTIKPRFNLCMWKSRSCKKSRRTLDRLQSHSPHR
jgi:hypothetical protein